MTADESVEGACEGGNLLCNVVSDFAQSGMREFVQSLVEGAIDVVSWINQIWFAYSPWREVDLDNVGSNGELDAGYLGTSALADIQESLSAYTAVFAVLGFLIAVGKMIIARELRAGAGALGMIVRLIVVTSVMSAAFASLMFAGDSFAKWILTEADETPMDLTGLINTSALTTVGLGPGLLLGLLALLGALANIAFLIVRDALILVMFAFLPTLAASTVSDSGSQAFKKALAWLLAFLLYKPIAATIWALGLYLVKNPTVQATENITDWEAMYQSLIGVVILLCTALALPAIIKFVSPVASAGTSSAFSGGAVAGAAVAVGAAVVTLGATAGASAAGAGAGSAAGSGAAASNSAAGAGGAAAGNTNPPPSGGAAPTAGGGTSPGGSSPSGERTPSSGQASTGAAPSAPSDSSGTAPAGASTSAGGGTTGAGTASAAPDATGTTSAPEGAVTAAPSPTGAAAAPSGPAFEPASGSAGVREAARTVGDVAAVSRTADGAISETTEGESQ